MSMLPGTRLGPYEVIDSLGAGGMGEVYRARDTKLDRDVALKILPESFASDPDRLMRFEREAKTLASLNHPNIAAIYGIEESGFRGPGVPESLATRALVMELVEGDDLSHRIAQGALPIEDALPIARQIAEALEAAHEAGIIHRDLKPANIKVRPDGTVKVLDFGLAKAMDTNVGRGFSRADNGAPEGTPYVPSSSPTMTSPALTAMGLILGTAAYMSPEQAKGRSVDKRADIWAFGVVLHEMLTGKRLFEAEDMSETLAAVLTRDVSQPSLPANVPPRLRLLIRDCLVRDPKQRLRDIGDARLVIDRVMSGTPDDLSAATSATTVLQRGQAWVWPAMVLLTVAAAGTWALLRPAPPAPPTVQFTVSPSSGVEFKGGAFPISPDGRMLAYVGIQAGKRLVWVHSLETGTAQAIPSTEGVTEGVTSDGFAWSPDSRKIAFRTEDKLKQVSVEGGPAHTICSLDTSLALGVSWGSNDVILIGSPTSPLVRVSAAGGQPEAATELDASKQEVRHLAPHFLPDGRHFLFLAMGGSAAGAVAYVGELDSKVRRLLPGISTGAHYSPTGHVLFLRDGALMAQVFDLGRFELSGEPFPVVDSVGSFLGLLGIYSTSSTGTLAYRTRADQTSRLIWFDRTGKRLANAGPVGDFGDIELSQDDRHVTYESAGDIWVLDVRNAIPQRVTSDKARDADPVWSPDTKTIAFRSDRDGGRLYSRGFGVVGPDVPLLRSETRDSPASWSRDGKYLAYESGGDIWALPMGGDPKPIRVTEPAAGISRGGTQISPDGHWVAYHSSEMGSTEVFIQSFPQPGAKQRVSAAGGTVPRWSRDGKELYYVAPTQMLMAATVTISGNALTVGPPVALFQLNIPSGDEGEYDTSTAGRFLVNTPESQASESPITVILNWVGRLKK